MLWYYARIYGRVRFAPRWLFLCVDSARADHTWPGRGEMFSARRLQVSRVLQIWPSQAPFPPCRIGSSASLHKRRFKRLRALSECQLGGRFPFFNKVIRTTQIPSTVYPGPLPTWFHWSPPPPPHPPLSEGINVNRDENQDFLSSG